MDTEKEKSPKNKKVSWIFDRTKNEICVDQTHSNLAEVESNFVFKLTRYKDDETHEESLKIESFIIDENNKLVANGEIHSYIYSLDNDIKGLMRYGVAFSDVVFIKLTQEIKDAYLKLKPINPETENKSSNRLDSFLSSLGSYFLIDDDNKDINKEFLYIPVNDFNDLALDCNYKKIELSTLRKYLADNDYVRTLNGRTAILIKIKGKPIRVLAFFREKMNDYMIETDAVGNHSAEV